VTTLARPRPRSGGRRSGARHRLGRLLSVEARLLLRLQVLTATALLTALWIVVLLAVPPGVRDVLAPVVLLTDVTALGFLFVPALLALERVEHADDALRMTPTRPGERICARVGGSAALAAVAATAVTLAAGLPGAGQRVLGVVLLSTLFALVSVVLMVGAPDLMTLLVRLPVVAVPLLAPALVHLAGLVSSPVLQASPATAAVDLLRGQGTPAGVVWQLCWIAAVAVLAVRTAGRPTPAPAAAAPARRSTAWPAHAGRFSRWEAVRSFARTDRRTLVGDATLLLLVGSVPLLTGALRLVSTVGVDWAERRYGVPLAHHLPLAAALLLVLHTPVMFGSMTGLLLLEDRDAGLLGPLAATRASLSTLLGYRLGATAALTTGALAVCLPLTGVGHPAGPVGHLATAVAAGAVSVVPALLLAGVATTRVQGVAVMKVIGLPLYLPLATWFVAGPAAWLAAPIPTAWVAWAAWVDTPAAAVGLAVGGIAVSSVVALVLGRRWRRRSTAR
jgi:hypothetical protein